MPRANLLSRSRYCASTLQRCRSDTTSPETTTVPALRPGASPPAMPKLTRHFARAAAVSTSALVRSRSPAPTTTENPAARAILASTARPEVHSTVASGCVCAPTIFRRLKPSHRDSEDGRRLGTWLTCGCQALTLFALWAQPRSYAGRWDKPTRCDVVERRPRTLAALGTPARFLCRWESSTRRGGV